MSTARDEIINRVRTALGRKLGDKPAAPPEPLLRIGAQSLPEQIAAFRKALEALSGTVAETHSREETQAVVKRLLDGRTAIASAHPLLADQWVTEIEGVQSGLTGADLRNACASASVGITSAYCLLAETGTIVYRASAEEPRLISLLPPVHIAVVSARRILGGLDEMLSMIARPVDDSSAMVFITGPSRTGDIEQILVRGVHGPGQVHVVIVHEEETR
jgi:L-lactate dehydrogenase complex protein LldG